MRAIQITQLTGPTTALAAVEVDPPGATSPLTGDAGVLIDVRCAGVAFPEVLQTRGMYQIKPDLPFVPGSEVAGLVRQAPAGSGLSPGQPVMAFCGLGGFAEVAVAPVHLCFALPQPLDFAQGAALILNYHTAHFSLVRRGRLQAGETVLVHGAAGGLGTAALQVAKGLGAHTIAVVSDDAKAEIAAEMGADHVLRSTDAWKDAARELTGGGVNIVFDPVGGDRFTDSLRALAPEGRVIVAGFAGGSIPEVKVNRLLLGNTDVIGAGWGGFAISRPSLCAEIGADLDRLIAAGAVRPVVGERFPLARASDALELIDSRRAVGKVVLDVSASADR
jgi:NADPH2:quinone reductase